MSNKVKYRGAALVELAILIIPMAMLLFGLIEAGRILYQQGQLNKLTEAATRYISRGDGIIDEDNNCQIIAVPWNDVRDRAQNLSFYGDIVSGSLAEILPGLALTVTSTYRTGTGGVDACIVTVSATYTYQNLLGVTGFLDFFGGVQISSQSEEVYIGA
jgi:Flp pilus assembly protein TadG